MSDASSTRAAAEGAEPGARELIGKLANEAGVLVRQEASLAAVEMAEKARTITRLLWTMGTGTIFILLGGQVLVAALVLALSMVIPLWMATLAVGAGLTLIGLIAAYGAKAGLARIELVPQKTIQTLKEGATWAQRLVQ